MPRMRTENKGNKIFLSSTFEDFEIVRDDLLDLFARMQLDFDAMELFEASPGKAINECLRKLKKCQIYLGILGQKYGSIDKKLGKSFTHIEYEYAFNLYKKKSVRNIWIFLPSKNCYFRSENIESDPIKFKKLKKFQNMLMRRHTIKTYDSIDDLKLKIILQCERLIGNPLSMQDLKGKIYEIQKELFDEYLDSNNKPITIEGIKFWPSKILEILDPTAYKEIFLSWKT